MLAVDGSQVFDLCQYEMINKIISDIESFRTRHLHVVFALFREFLLLRAYILIILFTIHLQVLATLLEIRIWMK